MNRLKFRFCLVALLIIFIGYTSAASDERIISFKSDIVINTDGSMIVTESIQVKAEGINIKHGIFRDFPTKYEDSFGNDYNVNFEILEVKRDNRSEEYHTEKLSNGIRVYCGKKDYILPDGFYNFEIKYKTDRQLGFFDNYDELYWNVTGNGWDFVIENASVVVHLPSGIMKSDISITGYTGRQGEKGKDFRSEIESGSKVKFYTTNYLAPHEGITIVVQFPKGVVSEPSQSEKFQYFLEDNLSVLIGILGIVILIIYYIIIWFRVGKDPAKGTIIPLYEAPDKLSPGAVRFIKEMGFDNKTFTAGIVNLAVKGYLKIEEKKGDYTIHKLNPGQNTISKEENDLYKLLPVNLELKQKNHSTISNAIKKFKNSLKNSYEKIYFITNRVYFAIGLAITIFFMILIGISSSEDFIFSLVWLTIWSFGVGALLFSVFKSWKGAIVNGRIKIAALSGAVFITIFSIPFIIGEIAGMYFLSTAGTPLMIAILGIMATVNLMFYHLLKAPTMIGRKVMDRIEGLRMYLSTAEKDRLEAMKSPEKTPEVFEKFLPFALALDVENKWAEKFSDVLNVKEAYSPGWYSGAGWSSMGAAGFASSLGGSLSSTISSSSTAPGSSSGGSGGSSGGGGGGGGGGGW